MLPSSIQESSSKRQRIEGSSDNFVASFKEKPELDELLIQQSEGNIDDIPLNQNEEESKIIRDDINLAGEGSLL